MKALALTIPIGFVLLFTTDFDRIDLLQKSFNNPIMLEYYSETPQNKNLIQNAVDTRCNLSGPAIDYDLNPSNVMIGIVQLNDDQYIIIFLIQSENGHLKQENSIEGVYTL